MFLSATGLKVVVWDSVTHTHVQVRVCQDGKTCQRQAVNLQSFISLKLY